MNNGLYTATLCSPYAPQCRLLLRKSCVRGCWKWNCPSALSHRRANELQYWKRDQKFQTFVA